MRKTEKTAISENLSLRIASRFRISGKKRAFLSILDFLWLGVHDAALCFGDDSAGGVGHLKADTLTFDDVPGGSIQNWVGDMPTYKGFNFSYTLDWIDVVGSSWNYGAHSGDFALLNNYGGVGVVVDAGGFDFTFDGLWAKQWGTAPNSGGTDTLFGTISGYKDGSLVWSTNTALNGSYKFFGPQSGLIDELRLGMGNHFLADDISLNMSPVPTPSSFAALAGMGAVGTIAAVRRRRKRK